MPTSNRWRAATALLLLAACSEPSRQTADAQAIGAAEVNQRSAAEDNGSILCARGGNTLRRDCIVEQSQSSRGLVLTIRHADGAFHRLLVTRDGRGVMAADGAEPARVTASGAQSIDVAIGADRYRLPATIKAGR